MEDRKKLGVEDLVQAQKETSDHLSVIAERLEWLCDKEETPANYGMVWLWMVPMLFLLLVGTGRASEEPLGPLLFVVAISLVCLVALSFKDRAKTARRQQADRLGDLAEMEADKAFLSRLRKKG